MMMKPNWSIDKNNQAEGLMSEGWGLYTCALADRVFSLVDCDTPVTLHVAPSHYPSSSSIWYQHWHMRWLISESSQRELSIFFAISRVERRLIVSLDPDLLSWLWHSRTLGALSNTVCCWSAAYAQAALAPPFTLVNRDKCSLLGLSWTDKIEVKGIDRSNFQNTSFGSDSADIHLVCMVIGGNSVVM